MWMMNKRVVQWEALKFLCGFSDETLIWQHDLSQKLERSHQIGT
jgi:hypothetical protein